jgi:hypothetical protein
MRKPISERKLAANRANAKKSTGPRTPQGKRRSSMNGLLHGLTAKRTVVLPTEDRRDFECFARAMRADLRPRGAVQALIVGEVIEAAWKLRRADKAQWEFVSRAMERFRSERTEVTAAALLAAAAGGDERAAGYLLLDDYAGRLQRSLFSALRRLRAQKELDRELRRETQGLVSEANFDTPSPAPGGETNSVHDAGYDGSRNDPSEPSRN